MKRILLFAFILMLSVSTLACTSASAGNVPQQTGEADIDKADEAAVRSIVENFGKKLQMVSLQAPKDLLEKSMKENYGEFVSKELIAKWIGDPLNSPGRLTSSPWPDRIEILDTKKLSANEYQVNGKIIEIVNAENLTTSIAANRPIAIVLKKVDKSWIITEVTLGDYDEASSVIYKNTQYGFNFPLPDSWKGYKIVTGKWEGTGKVNETGPMISIRHPKWTSQNPRQDIPILIFTIAQWNSLQKDEFHIGAAPIGPSELGRTTAYVFALPARYNYAFPTGYEEVEEILKSNPIQTIDDSCGVEEPKPDVISLKSYFPISVGNTWKYLGDGNEYASFNRKVLFTEGDRAQTVEDNGGTVSASVFKITEKEIMRTFFQGEEYGQVNLLDKESNDNTVILKAPLKVGTKCETSKDVREIVETDAVVNTPAGKFEGCIRVSIKSQNSTMYEYFKAGIGMVKREFVSEGMSVTSTLEKYEIK